MAFIDLVRKDGSLIETLEVPDEEFDQWVVIAETMGMSIEEFLKMALIEYMDEKNKK